MIGSVDNVFHLTWFQKNKMNPSPTFLVILFSVARQGAMCHALFLKPDNHITGTKISSAALPAISEEREKT